jgi:ribosomal protein L12E/L44/L45/RPP1/RPP2
MLVVCGVQPAAAAADAAAGATAAEAEDDRIEGKKQTNQKLQKNSENAYDC